MHVPRPVDGIKAMSRGFSGGKEELKSSLSIQEITVQFLSGCPEGNASCFYLCEKKTEWRTELLEGFARPILPSMGSLIAGRGRVMVVILSVVESSS